MPCSATFRHVPSHFIRGVTSTPSDIPERNERLANTGAKPGYAGWDVWLWWWWRWRCWMGVRWYWACPQDANHREKFSSLFAERGSERAVELKILISKYEAQVLGGAVILEKQNKRKKLPNKESKNVQNTHTQNKTKTLKKICRP